MRISDIARRSGASQKAIRLYEARGLLAPVPRINRYRDYSEQDLTLVLLIRQAQALGFRLAEVVAVRRPDGSFDGDRLQALLAQRQQAVRGTRRHCAAAAAGRCADRPARRHRSAGRAG
ncbi:MerR family transcriptional regulator [Stenotrophomonas nematodicola]|uniref:MerR family transcriptional regulator n=1 Tax=Stenotrophomonas nematodicola TaxID=2656746 RepID=UPI001E65D68F|nr:MerR family transcriptional regulator [Stenotrophomonas nematodicola]